MIFAGLRSVEHNEVLVAVGEIAGIPLVEVVGEVRLGIVHGVNPGVLVADAAGFVVEHDPEDASGLDSMPAAGLDMNFGGVGEAVVGAGALPEGNSLGLGELEVFAVELVGGVIQVHAGRLFELGEQNHLEPVAGGESLLAADVEQDGHSTQTVHIQAHDEAGVPQEVRVGDGLSRSQALAEFLVVHIQEVHSTRASLTRIRAAVVQVVERVGDEAVDGPHDQTVVLDGHGLLHLVEEHGHEGVHLARAGEGALELVILDSLVDFEGDKPIVELGVGAIRLVDEGVIGRPIGELPGLVDGGLGHIAGDLHHNGAVLPGIHHDTGRVTAIGAVNHLETTDAVHEALNKPALPVVEILKLTADQNHILQIFLKHTGLADDFLGDGVHQSMNLFNPHFTYLLFILFWLT